MLDSEFENTMFKIDFKTDNIYLMGNYVKYSRFLSQTPWELDG